MRLNLCHPRTDTVDKIVRAASPILLTLDGDGISLMEFTMFVGALNSIPSLTMLTFAGNEIGVDRAKILGDALKTNTSLKTLRLRWNPIGSIGTIALVDALQTNTFLTELSLEDNRIDSIGVNALARLLENNSSIVTLKIRDNWLESSGAIVLGEALKKNTTLTHLDLGFNMIGQDGLRELALCLRYNSSLATLILDGNGYHSFIDSFFESYFSHGVSLKSLSLGSVHLGRSGIRSLIAGLQNNTSLTYLNLRSSVVMGPKEVEELNDGLADNYTILSLPGFKCVDGITDRNRKLYQEKCRSVWAVLMIARFRMRESNIPPGVHPEIMCRVAKILYRLPHKPPQSEKRRKKEIL